MGMHGRICSGPHSAAKAWPQNTAASRRRLTAAPAPPNPQDVLPDGSLNPFRVHWVRTHGIKPKCRDTPCYLTAHAPRCVSPYEAAKKNALQKEAQKLQLQ